VPPARDRPPWTGGSAGGTDPDRHGRICRSRRAALTRRAASSRRASRPTPARPPRRAHVRGSPVIEAHARLHSELLPRPRLLACDIDGTLLDDRGILPASIRDAIAAIAGSGVEVVLATGRSPWSGIAELTERLGLPGPHITMQGALVSVPATGEVHRLRALAPALYSEAIGFADELGIDAVVALLDGHRAERLPDIDEFFVTPLTEGRGFRYVEGLERLVDERPIRVFLPTGPERHGAVRRLVVSRFAGRASIVWSDLTGVEILAPGTHKGEAVSWLASTRGISPEEVAAVGDAANDAEMLRGAGWSAAMGSAPPDVRACADIVVPPSRDLGVLDAFAWFFPDLAGDVAPRAGDRPALVTLP